MSASWLCPLCVMFARFANNVYNLETLTARNANFRTPLNIVTRDTAALRIELNTLHERCEDSIRIRTTAQNQQRRNRTVVSGLIFPHQFCHFS